MEVYKIYVLIIVVFGLQIISHHNVLSIGESCKNAVGNSPGVCISITDCEPYMQLLRTQGARVGNSLRSTVCRYENSGPIVCCPNSNANTNVPTRKPVQSTPTTTTTTTKTTSDSKYGPIYAPKCGVSSNQGRIVGGTPAEVDAWPWMAVLGYKNKATKRPLWLCGGSLISTRHILTAAHCVYNRYDLYLARLGELDVNSTTDGARPVDYPIMRGTLHPEYNNVTHINDIAVLRLKLEVTFTNSIRPICLPVTSEMKNRDFVRFSPFIAGWGSVFFRGPRSTSLLQAQVSVVPLEECKNVYRRYNYEVSDGAICAGSLTGATDACQGDSGGPMMLPMGSNFYIIGVISLSYRCAEVGVPAVYTKVSNYLDFILTNLN